MAKEPELDPAEIRWLAAEAWNRTNPDGWQWTNLTYSERQEWLLRTSPIIRAVLQAQRAQKQETT